jgi:Flp pilus assembly protein TadB
MTWLKFGRHAAARQQTLQLVSLLCRWCQVREDLLYAFERSIEAGLGNPMQGALKELTIRVKGGMPVDQALNLLQAAVNHENFHDLVAAIRFNFRYRGDLPTLLEQLEWQMNKIEEEYDRRRLSNARDRYLTLGILLAVPLFLFVRLFGSVEMRTIFLEDAGGFILLVAGSLCYGLAILGYILIQRRIAG